MPLPAPRAVLLDFGGVVAQVTPREDWLPRMADEVAALLGASRARLPRHAIAADIAAGAAAESMWKNAMSRPPAPRDLSQQEFWVEFVGGDWPEPARAVLRTHAARLSRRIGELRADRVVTPGMVPLLDLLRGFGIPVAIVSNALSGAVHRDFLAAAGLADRFAAQIYSDEVGVRKPNPLMIELACRAVDVRPGDVWYVGDVPDRDVVCGRRAGVAATILMRSGATNRAPYCVRSVADLEVSSPGELAELVRAAR